MIRKTKFLAKEAVLRVKYMTARDCIFCKIVNGKMPAKAVFEDDLVIAFPDVNPVSDVHILIIPKRHIESVLTVSGDDSKDIVAMYLAAQHIVEDKKLGAFRLAFNGGKHQHVPHLHMHLLSGSKIEWRKL